MLGGLMDLPVAYRTEKVTEVQNQSGMDLCRSYSVLVRNVKSKVYKRPLVLYSSQRIDKAGEQSRRLYL